MSTAEVAEAIVEWAKELIEDLQAGYPYPLAASGALPDVVATVKAIRVIPEDRENFPFAALEQTWLQIFDIEISIMVAQGDEEAEVAEAHETLEGYADTLIGSIVADATLGDRVQMASPRIEIDLGEPFVERPDGTRGRVLFGELHVAELVDALS